MIAANATYTMIVDAIDDDCSLAIAFDGDYRWWCATNGWATAGFANGSSGSSDSSD